MKFTDTLKATIKECHKQSVRHPFIQQLADGSLPKETFRYYLCQDHQYLSNFQHLHELIAK